MVMVPHKKSKIAVLLMAHGGPDSLEDIEPFLGHIMKHRTTTPPSPELVATVKGRYELIGGRSPLLEITTAQAAALQSELNRREDRFRVYVGMRHWSPFIKDTVQQIIDDKPDHLVAISMAPQHSRMSVGAYIEAAKKALVDLHSNLSVSFVNHWHDQPLLLDAFSKKVKKELLAYSEEVRQSVFVLFTAHSLPQSILAENDSYPTHLQETVNGVVTRLGSLLSSNHWGFAYQSQGMSGGSWLSPDVAEMIPKIAGEGGGHLLIAPIGFLADHVEILYDIDIYYKEIAEKNGIQLRRIESLNTSPLFIQALASVVHTYLPM